MQLVRTGCLGPWFVPSSIMKRADGDGHLKSAAASASAAAAFSAFDVWGVGGVDGDGRRSQAVSASAHSSMPSGSVRGMGFSFKRSRPKCDAAGQSVQR